MLFKIKSTRMTNGDFWYKCWQIVVDCYVLRFQKLSFNYQQTCCLHFQNFLHLYTVTSKFLNNGAYQKSSLYTKKAAKLRLKTTDQLLIYVALRRSLSGLFWTELVNWRSWLILISQIMGNMALKKRGVLPRLVCCYNVYSVFIQ